MADIPMADNNNQGENSSQIVQQLLPPKPHHANSETNPQNNNSAGGGGPSPNRRPRGRPRGSKNKPKAPYYINREIPNSFKLHVLEVSSGSDIVETLNNYATRRGRGVCIFNGKGTVSSVIIRQPASSSSSSGGVITLPGAFEIISIAGAVLPSPAPPGSGGLSIFISGGQGQVLGGTVVGPLIATGAVTLMAASFANAVFERIPLEEHVAAVQGDAGNGANQVQQVEAVTSQASTATGSVGAGLPLFDAGTTSYAFSVDLLGWVESNAAAARPPV